MDKIIEKYFSLFENHLNNNTIDPPPSYQEVLQHNVNFMMNKLMDEGYMIQDKYVNTKEGYSNIAKIENIVKREEIQEPKQVSGFFYFKNF